MVEFFTFVVVLVLAIAVYALFCVLPAWVFIIGERGDLAVAYFFLSTLLFYLSHQLGGIKIELEKANSRGK